MDPTDFPPNSHASKDLSNQPRVQRVTTGVVKTKKQSTRKRFKEAFLGGDMKTAVGYTIFDIALPELRDFVWSVFSGGFEKLIYGDGRRRSGGSSGWGGQSAYQQQPRYSYNRAYTGGPLMDGPTRALSRSARSRHNFDEVILESRSEAEEVITQMFEVISHYGKVSVADLYDLVGLPSNHTDYKWGWTSLRGAGSTRVRDGYLLDLPDPEPLDD